MKLLARSLSLAALLGVTSLAANAQIIYNGAIERTGGSPIGSPFGSPVNASLDYFPFTVNSAGAVTFDVRAWEADSNSTGAPVDLNGDGRFTLVDTQIAVFFDDGNLDAGDLVAINDDDFSNGFGDGTIFGFDSYLSLNLAPGAYTIGIGQFPLSVAEAVAGQQSNKAYPVETFDGGVTYVVTDTAPYRLTITGDLFFPAAVPEPGTVALLVGMGISGLALRRRKK